MATATTNKSSSKPAATRQKADESLKVMSPIGRVAFPHVFDPHSFDDKAPAFSLILVFPEGTDLKELKAACARAAIQKFGDKEKVKALMNAGKLRFPWRDGSDYAEYGEPFVEGATFITIKTNQAPGIVNERAKPIMNQMDFYAGCFARATMLCWGYDSMGNKGVTLLLNNVQKTGDGTRLSGRSNPEDEFEPVATAKGAKGAKGGDEDVFDVEDDEDEEDDIL